MKVLHIITSLDPGGAQSMLRDLLRVRKEDSDPQHVVALSDGALADDIQASAASLHQLDLRRGAAAAYGLSQLARLIRENQPDLIQTWLYHADFLGGVAARLSTRAPVVWGLHHTLSAANSLRPSTRWIVRANALLSGWMPARIVCCAQSALESHALRGYRRERMLVIANGVDTKRFRPDPSAPTRLRHELGLSEETRLIGMFARFHRQKDHGTLIAAAGRLVREDPGVHLVLAGEGVDGGNAALRGWIAATGCAANFHLLGTRRDMARLYGALDLFTLSSSDGEALPLVIAEAMACGVPCVATDVGDTAALIGETGVVVPPRSAATLADGLLLLLDESPAEHERRSMAARRRIEHGFDLHVAASAYQGLYDGILRTRLNR
jgi:glycosyltransferase involved in cell wall biosynthesis